MRTVRFLIYTPLGRPKGYTLKNKVLSEVFQSEQFPASLAKGKMSQLAPLSSSTVGRLPPCLC